MFDSWLAGKIDGSMQFFNKSTIFFVPRHSFSAQKSVTRAIKQESVYINFPVMVDTGKELYCDENFTLTYLPNAKQQPIITNTNMKPRKQVINYIKENRDKIKSYAEIGVKFGATAEAVANELPAATMDLYERERTYCRYLRSFLPNATVHEGEADLVLRADNKLYDLVYFDCSHRYKIDKPILDSLIPHLRQDSTVIFDDYSNFDDIRRLVLNFKAQTVCNIEVI